MNKGSKEVMERQRLLASAALFRGLYDNKRDIYSVLSEFIKESIAINGAQVFDVTECAKFLAEDFGFEIPEAVIKTCIRKRLKDHAKLDKGKFTLISEIEKNPELEATLKEKKTNQQIATEALITHANEAIKNFNEKETLISDFYLYLLDEQTNTKYRNTISKFIILNSANVDLNKIFAEIKEGLILYHGIKYSPEASSGSSWQEDLTLFLDTEILFRAMGLGGDLHLKLFKDFHQLVKDVNRSSKNGKIELRYFNDSLDEVHNYFHVAEKIVDKRISPDPSKDAMRNIVNGCKYPSDVIEKKTRFLDSLATNQITPWREQNYYDPPIYSMESAELLKDLTEKTSWEEDKIASTLKQFTKINFLRKGQNNQGLKKAKAILVSEKAVIRTLAFSPNFYTAGGIPFATDLEFLTERLWIDLNRGFGNGLKAPASFDMVVRAQMILSAQAGNKVAEQYEKLKNDVNDKKITAGAASNLLEELREKAVKPEDIRPETVEETLNFLSIDFIEHAVREATLLKIKAEDGENHRNRLLNIMKSDKRNIASLKKIEITKKYNRKLLFQAITYAAITTAIFVIIATILISSSDTPLSLFWGLLSFLGILTPLTFWKKLKEKTFKPIINEYRSTLKNEFKAVNKKYSF